MDVIEADVVVMGLAGTIAPGPADGNPRVVEVVNVVVFDHVVWRVGDPHAGSRRVHPAAVGDQALPHGVVRRDFFRVVLRDPSIQRAAARVADLDPAGGHVHHLAVLDEVVATSGSQGHRIAAHVPHGTTVNHQVPRPNRRNGAVQVHFRLAEGLAPGGHDPVGMGKRQAAETKVLDPAAGFRVTLQNEQPVQPRGHDDRLVRMLGGHGDVAQLPAGPVQVPLTRLSERFPHVIDQEPLPFGKGSQVVRSLGSPRQRNDMLCRVDRANVQSHAGPTAKDLDFHAAVVGPFGPQVVARVAEPVVPLASRSFRGRKLLVNQVITVLGKSRAESPLLVHE